MGEDVVELVVSKSSECREVEEIKNPFDNSFSSVRALNSSVLLAYQRVDVRVRFSLPDIFDKIEATCSCDAEFEVREFIVGHISLL